jgi:CheY-like chemotaxis protein
MSKNKLKILIVEDSPEWIKFHVNLLNELLEKDSCEIDFEMSAGAGFNRVIKNTEIPYDLIISDLEMEEIQGESYAGSWFIRNIIKREECKNSKILIISGSHDIHEAAKELNVDFIPKYVLSNNPVIMSYKLEEVGF